MTNLFDVVLLGVGMFLVPVLYVLFREYINDMITKAKLEMWENDEA